MFLIDSSIFSLQNEVKLSPKDFFYFSLKFKSLQMMITQNHRREDFDFSTLANICDEYDSSISSQSSLNSPVDEPDHPPQSMTETIPPTTDPDYLFESNRLKTFDHNWPHSAFLDPRKMAAAGFYYLGEADICRCVFCNVKIGNWEVGDDPMREHQRWADYCSFVRHRPTGNVPITVTNPPMGIPSNSLENQTYDECGMYNFRDMMPVEVRPNTTTEKGGNNTLEVMGVTKARAPSFPHMGPYDSRLNSFKSWPKSIKQRPEELCEAGFYYSGIFTWFYFTLFFCLPWKNLEIKLRLMIQFF